MFTTIFSSLPQGVTVRRLHEDRRAKNQKKAYKFSGRVNNSTKLVYGNSMQEVVKKLKLEMQTVIK